jgi:hypothetical protein
VLVTVPGYFLSVSFSPMTWSSCGLVKRIRIQSPSDPHNSGIIHTTLTNMTYNKCALCCITSVQQFISPLSATIHGGSTLVGNNLLPLEVYRLMFKGVLSNDNIIQAQLYKRFYYRHVQLIL